VHPASLLACVVVAVPAWTGSLPLFAVVRVVILEAAEQVPRPHTLLEGEKSSIRDDAPRAATRGHIGETRTPRVPPGDAPDCWT
jgi:hypothetical protein